MSDVSICNYSFQARLHQVENARSREMKAHGEQVRQLESKLESLCSSDAELRLTVAKLRADNCRLQAELCASQAKHRHLLEQLDAVHMENVKRNDDFEAKCKENECRLEAVSRRSEQLIEEKRQLNLDLCTARAELERSKHEGSLLQTKYGEQGEQLKAQVLENSKLATQLTSNQQESQVIARRSELLLEDLSSTQEKKNVLEERVKDLEHEVARVLVIQNRALSWRRKRHITLEKYFLSIKYFLTWKSGFVHAGFCKLTRSNSIARAEFQTGKQQVFHSCSQAKELLKNIRQACTQERSRLQSLRDKICQVELPKLQALLQSQENAFKLHRQSLEAQVKGQREHSDLNRERLEMSRQDLENRVHKISEAYHLQRRHEKWQQRVIHQFVSSKRRHESRRRTFYAWKDCYFRSVVGQATHTAMVYKSQIVEKCRMNRDICHLTSTTGGASSIDMIWKKWRRLETGNIGLRCKLPHQHPI